jgi:Fe2+ or Zn2+ uptake regulation protein
MPAAVEKFLEEEMSDVVHQTGFALVGHRLDLLGQCAACRTDQQ